MSIIQRRVDNSKTNIFFCLSPIMTIFVYRRIFRRLAFYSSITAFAHIAKSITSTFYTF